VNDFNLAVAKQAFADMAALHYALLNANRALALAQGK
jgi:hypothetical protein